MQIKDRSRTPIDLRFFDYKNYPEDICGLELDIPKQRKYLLRLPIKEPFSDFKIPDEYTWTKPLIDIAYRHQLDVLNIRQPFCYLTIRNGVVNTTTDDTWHTDGFSQSITHLPEQNYVWVNHTPTECAVKRIKFPLDFDAMKYNVHLYLKDNIFVNDNIIQIKAKTVYCMDPYIIHRRPEKTRGSNRCFIRISFTPMEIYDKNNAYNPDIPRSFKRDGVKDFRDSLERYYSIQKTILEES